MISFEASLFKFNKDIFNLIFSINEKIDENITILSRVTF